MYFVLFCWGKLIIRFLLVICKRIREGEKANSSFLNVRERDLGRCVENNYEVLGFYIIYIERNSWYRNIYIGNNGFGEMRVALVVIFKG